MTVKKAATRPKLIAEAVKKLEMAVCYAEDGATETAHTLATEAAALLTQASEVMAIAIREITTPKVEKEARPSRRSKKLK